MSAAPPSSEASGVAAALRADKKNAKYKPLAAAVSSEFYAAVVERYGACGGSLMGWLKHLCGDREREALECDDYSFSQSSRVTYMASLTVFAAVIGDACMIDRVLALDATEAPEERVGVGVGTGSGRGRGRPVVHGQREVEGIGGQFWYEAAGAI